MRKKFKSLAKCTEGGGGTVDSDVRGLPPSPKYQSGILPRLPFASAGEFRKLLPGHPRPIKTKAELLRLGARHGEAPRAFSGQPSSGNCLVFWMARCRWRLGLGGTELARLPEPRPRVVTGVVWSPASPGPAKGPG